MKITKEQWKSLPQLDRIEINQVVMMQFILTATLWIILYIIILAGHFFLSLLLGVYVFWRSFKYDKDNYNKMMESYFEVQVKRNAREVKK